MIGRRYISSTGSPSSNELQRLEYITEYEAPTMAAGRYDSFYVSQHCHYGDVTRSTMASQITSLTIVYSTVIQAKIKKTQQSSASLAFVRGIHRSPVNSPHKWPVTRKMFPSDGAPQNSLVYREVSHYNDVIMSAMASQITGVPIVCSTVCSGVDQSIHQSSASLAFVRGIRRWPMASPSQRGNNAENVSIWWRNHVARLFAVCGMLFYYYPSNHL